MNDELTPEQKFAADDSEAMVSRALTRGRRQEEIVAELLRLDWSPEAARTMVARVANDLARFQHSPESRRQLVREARRQMFLGIATSIMGVLLTITTLFGAGALPFFIVTYGLILVGLVVAGRGWARWRLYRGVALPFDNESPPSSPP